MKLNAFLKHAVAAAALAGAASAAQADTFQFVLTGSYNAQWQLTTPVVPDDYADGVGFIVYDVAGNFPGSAQNLIDITFWHADAGGAFSLDDFYGDTTLLITDGVQLYSGTEDAPTYLTGSFNLTEYGGTGAYTLNVTNVSAVPEPTALALMLGGLGVVGAAVRRRKTAA